MAKNTTPTSNQIIKHRDSSHVMTVSNYQADDMVALLRASDYGDDFLLATSKRGGWTDIFVVEKADYFA